MKHVLPSEQSQALERPWGIAGLPEQCPWDLTPCSRIHFPGRPWWLGGVRHLCCTRSAAADLSREGQGCQCLRSALPEAGPLLAMYVLSQSDIIADQAGFLLPCPHFQVAKHSASISSARIYAEGTECCQNKTLNHQCTSLFYEE